MVMPTCACKGIRTCLICEKPKAAKEDDEKKSAESEKQAAILELALNCDASPTFADYRFCRECGDKAWLGDLTIDHVNHDQLPSISSSSSQPASISIKGVFVAVECITQEEEAFLVQQIDAGEWVDSQSGRRKQDFGPKVNFKKRKCKVGSFRGLPLYIRDILASLKERHNEVLSDFLPVELCNLEYEPTRGAAIDPHLDDVWLWGERLVTLNYLSSTMLTLTKPEGEGAPNSAGPNISISIEMPARSLLVLSGEARYQWLHSVKRGDISERRVATTLRELTAQFRPGGENFERTGNELLTVARNFF